MSFLGIGLPAFTELAGGLLGGALNSAYQRSRMQAQVGAMKDLWSFQQKNAHQYEVEDLRNAGLNPILSATNSQIASMPSVVTPTSAPYSGIGNGIGTAVTNGLKLDLEQKKLDIEKSRLENETLRNQAEVAKIKAESVTEAWKSTEISEKVKILKRELFERVDMYELKKELAEANLQNAWALTGKIGAEIEKLGSETGLNFQKTALLEKQYRLGTYLSGFLPTNVVEEFEDDPESAFRNNFDRIKKIVVSGEKVLAKEAYEYFIDLAVSAGFGTREKWEKELADKMNKLK